MINKDADCNNNYNAVWPAETAREHLPIMFLHSLNTRSSEMNLEFTGPHKYNTYIYVFMSG